MRRIVEESAELPEVKKAIEDFEQVIQYTMTDINAKWYLDTHGGKTTFHEGEAEKPFLKVVTDSETWEKILSGKMSPTRATLFGKIKVEGPMKESMKLGKVLDAWKGAYSKIKG